MTDLRTAAQQALEALEQAHIIGGQAACDAAITALRAALEQQAEPVEPAYKVKITGRWHEAEPLAAAFNLPDGEHLLYTTPQPQRKPLTDEDILRVLMLDPPNPSLWPHLKGEAIVGDVQQAVLAIVRAVERALEEKNRGR